MLLSLTTFLVSSSLTYRAVFLFKSCICILFDSPWLILLPWICLRVFQTHLYREPPQEPLVMSSRLFLHAVWKSTSFSLIYTCSLTISSDAPLDCCCKKRRIIVPCYISLFYSTISPLSCFPNWRVLISCNSFHTGLCLAGIELTFFIAAIRCCVSDLWPKQCWYTMMFQPLLNIVCTVPRLSLFLTVPPQRVDWG